MIPHLRGARTLRPWKPPTSRRPCSGHPAIGDVFGAPVNLASRLTDEARPRSVLVDATLAEALAEDGSYELKRLRKRSVRGYRSITPYLLRRTSVDV